MDRELGEPAPDGNLYVHFMEAPPALLVLYEELLAAAAQARGIPGPQGTAIADAISLLIGEVEDAVTAAGESAAVAADAAMRDQIVFTQKRPDNTGNLYNAIESRGVLSAPAGGAVGIADFNTLQNNAIGRDGVPYWRIQDEGSSHLVGHEVHGFFQPGDSPPDQSQSRVHPVFEPGQGPLMKVQNPIPAKNFLEAGRAAADATRLGLFRGIDRTTTAAISDIMAGSHPLVARAARARGGRRLPP